MQNHENEIVIGVSGINAVDNPGPGVGVARSLKEMSSGNVRIVGLAYDAMEPGIYMDWLIDESFLLPYPSNNSDEYIRRLLEIRNETGMSMIFPNLDAELPTCIKYSEKLSQNGIASFLPYQKQFRLRNKDRLADLAKQIGIRFPESITVASYDDLQRAVDRLGLPVMVKGAFYKAYSAATLAEAMTHYQHIVAEWGYPVIIQKVVTGEEMNTVAVGDGRGLSLGQVSIKKLWVTELGKIWNGITIQNEKMAQAVETFIRKTRWRGAFELECIVDDDDVYLIEINPRLPAWSYFATGVGINLPERIVRQILGHPVDPQMDYPAGKLFIRYTYELITDMDPFRNITMKGRNQE